MAKSKRAAADATPAGSKRSRKPDTEQQEAAAGSKPGRRRQKPTEAQQEAAAEPQPPQQQQQRKGRGAKTAAADAAPSSAKPAAKRKAAAAGAAGAAAGAAAAAAAASKPKPPFYLVKSEPDEFSIDMLKARTNQTEGWEGVRNYVARNHLRAMRLGDRAFFYHSSCKVPGIVGIVEVVREAYPDLTAQDKGSKYYDAKASPEDPRWSMVDFKLVRQLERQVTLDELKQYRDGPLASMALFTTARLSVQPVSQEEWDFVLALEKQPGPTKS